MHPRSARSFDFSNITQNVWINFKYVLLSIFSKIFVFDSVYNWNFHCQGSFAAAKKTHRKKSDETNLSGNLKAMATVTALKPENVWDLISVHGFLEAICR